MPPGEHRREILRRCTEPDTHANTFSDPNRDSYADGNCNARTATPTRDRYSNGNVTAARPTTDATAAPDSGTSTLEVQK